MNPINEKIFQFIWKHNLLATPKLKTVDGEIIDLVHPGIYNTNSGPDFECCKLKFNDTLIVGNVELHLKSSDWYLHAHEKNPAYQNVILHVVLKHDLDHQPHNIPIVELGNFVNEKIVNQATDLLNNNHQLPCTALIHLVPSITKQAMISRCIAERWERKAEEWQQRLMILNGDWHQLIYEQTAKNFGFHINSTPFEHLARQLPQSIIGKHKKNLLQIEALLFGVGGFLKQNNSNHPYILNLKKEWFFLKAKYNLQELEEDQWKFLRLRPANFPSIRIAQFAQLLLKSEDLLSSFLKAKSLKELYQHFDISLDGFWLRHYHFKSERSLEDHHEKLGNTSISVILINTLLPFLFFYGQQQNKETLKDQSLNWLEEIKAEKNHLVQLFINLNWLPENAADSQGMLELYHQYCSKKRCLECGVGLKILTSEK